MDRQTYRCCLEACARCATQCERCIETWREESADTELADCIALARDVADFCHMAEAMIERDSHFSAEVCRVCAEICDICAAQAADHDRAECQQLAHECQQCGDQCRRLTMAVIRA